ncbi:MAG: ABC transporter ATP-binding protein/permease [Solobacterium sp.]|jgi:ATP-binding cassette subfamily B protein|nr:ABC transporter ATP-binding protein/permease [Solobacterium sp.]MCH4205682.1 ABC transporter ATP-binding protein/permease [Solobacterium sp.]MCH4227206.1 ABC transporter ATP-binding protein/permease [Solobacterium sp.]MCH4282512.1 ABC transporter ATP-binding protein/permease [Solobacterium sp.]
MKHPTIKDIKQGEVNSWDTLKKVLHVIGSYKYLLILSIVLAGISVILQLYVPILFGNAIDAIIAQGNVDFDLVIHTLSRIILLVLLSSLAVYLMNRINNRMAYAAVRDIRAKAIRQIQVLPLSYLDGHSSGDIVSRMIADTDQLSDGLLLGFTQLFTGIVTIIATIAFMFSKNILITLLVVLATPLSFWIAKFIASHSYTMFRRQTKIRGDETSLIEEMVGNAKVVKAFGHEQKASEQFREVNTQLKDAYQKATFYSSLTNPSTRFVNSVIYGLVALIGSFQIFAQGLTVGGLSAMLSYANQYMKPFNDISSVITELQNALACAARIFALIEERPEKDAIDLQQDPSLIEALPKESVRIDHVSFSYRRDQKLIEDISLQARPGMHVAIVGPTGCGKTTLINLLMRFYDADQGDIQLDGTSIYQMDRHALRKNFGMVLQDTWLKNGTVRDNISIGKPEAEDAEIIQAAKEAHSWEFIRRLPQKLDTVLQEDSLSQGQKQLLCITRVMLCRPSILILDEATSSIDTRTEIMIQKAFDQLMEGRTSFIVAHRLSTIRNADLILVMKDGRIIERGSHEQLLAANGFYTSLYNSQFAKQ